MEREFTPEKKSYIMNIKMVIKVSRGDTEVFHRDKISLEIINHSLFFLWSTQFSKTKKTFVKLLIYLI